MNFLNWTPRLATILGVPLHIHVTLIALAIYVGVFVSPVVLLLGIGAFAGIAVHEYGHILAARYYGIDTTQVILTPLGGVALLEYMPKDAKQELVIAAAGPITSLVLGLWCLALAMITFNTTNFFLIMAIVNGGLAVFNLLPIGILDGGRMLRAALHFKYSYERATEIVWKVSVTLISVILVAAIINLDFILMLTMMFVIILTRAEMKAQRSVR